MRRPPRGVVGAGLILATPFTTIALWPWAGPWIAGPVVAGMFATGVWLFATSGH